VDQNRDTRDTGETRPLVIVATNNKKYLSRRPRGTLGSDRERDYAQWDAEADQNENIDTVEAQIFHPIKVCCSFSRESMKVARKGEDVFSINNKLSEKSSARHVKKQGRGELISLLLI
jgi:hypothetical protein